MSPFHRHDQPIEAREVPPLDDLVSGPITIPDLLRNLPGSLVAFGRSDDPATASSTST
jgi:hypothetical protein